MKLISTKIVIKNIAQDHKVTVEQTNDVIESVFGFIRDKMANDSNRETTYFPTIRVPYWCTFFVTPTVKERFKKINDKKNESI